MYGSIFFILLIVIGALLLSLPLEKRKKSNYEHTLNLNKTPLPPKIQKEENSKTSSLILLVYVPLFIFLAYLFFRFPERNFNRWAGLAHFFEVIVRFFYFVLIQLILTILTGALTTYSQNEKIQTLFWPIYKFNVSFLKMLGMVVVIGFGLVGIIAIF